MNLLRRIFGGASKRPSGQSAGGRGLPAPVQEHFAQFAATRQEVEAYIEPVTTVNDMTVILVARDGEWTRRRVPSEAAARKFAAAHKIPIYDVNLSGYPSAMREYNARQKGR